MRLLAGIWNRNWKRINDSNRYLSVNKKSKMYFKVYPEKEIPKELLNEVREFYNYLKQIDWLELTLAEWIKCKTS